MAEKLTAYANRDARTILPRHGSGDVMRNDKKPTLTAYDLSSIPSRVHARQVGAVQDKPVYSKSVTTKARRKKAQDPFIERLSRLG